MKFAALVLVALSTTGCLARRVRQEAAFILDCEQRVSVEHNEANKAWIAEGCGRFVVCQAPMETGAEVQCAGGAPPLRLATSSFE